jgi:F-type H+-transporting ATPase subunit b
MANILVLAPHPDDEVLGCGARIFKKCKQGDKVFVGILTNACKTDPVKYTQEKLDNVRAEALKACQFLGVEQVYFEDDYINYELSEINELIDKVKANELPINNALNSAEEARKQMSALKADNEKLLNQARAERDLMLKEANDMKENIIAQAKKSADEEGRKIIAKANESIESAKINAMNELKAQVAVLSVDLAEKVLRKKMEDRAQQESFVNENLKSITLK